LGKVSEEIGRNIESITSVTKQNASAIQQAAAASQRLARRAEQLQALCGGFTLDRSGAADTRAEASATGA
jgi:methyl-accepting chemotaxis protein